MSIFEPTEENYVKRIIRENTQQPQLGTITKVFEHDDHDDYSNFEVNVELRDSDNERRRIPVATSPFIGAIVVPEPGDTVLVDFLEGDGEFPVVTRFIHNAEDRAPLGHAGEVRFRKGELYFEMGSDGEYLRLAKKEDDLSDPDSVIEITDEGNINITGYKETETDYVTESGDGETTTFTLSHSLGVTPTTAHVQPTSKDAAGDFYVSDKTSGAVNITYLSAPNAGTDNLGYDITTTK